MMRQHMCSLYVLLMFIIINRNMLSTSDGMYVKIRFLNTNPTKLEYLPGAIAYAQTRYVMNIIQKLVATMNAMRPIMLIVHSTLFVRSIYPSTSDAVYNIWLISKTVSTCMMGMESCLHLQPKRVTSAIRKSMITTEHQALAFSTSIFISSIIIIIQLHTNNIIFMNKKLLS